MKYPKTIKLGHFNITIKLVDSDITAVGGEEGSFHSDPPNAVITWTYNKKIQEAEIIIDNVVSTENGVRYLFRIITGQIPKGELSNVSIFIDNLSSSNLTSGFIDLA